MRSELPRFGIHLVRPRFPLLPGLVALNCLSSPLLFAQSSPADGPWTGSIKCQLDVDTGTYKRRETQTWTITGPPLSTKGSVRVYPATWSATGEGSLHRAQDSQLIDIQWKVDVPPTSAQLAMFVRTSDKTLIISQQSSRMRMSRGITGTRTVTINGKQQPSSPINAVADEWTFGYLANDATLTTLTGSIAIDAEPLTAELSLAGAPRTATCTWQLSLNATPAAAGDQRLASPQLPPKTPVKEERDRSFLGDLGPKIIEVSPNSGEQWTDNQVITFTTQATNFVRGTTKIDLGPGITLVDPPLFITMATRGIGTFKIAGDATPGPRTITLTTGTEVATLPAGFTVTPRDVRDVFQVAPNTGTQGHQGLAVSITRPWRYFYTGTTLDFGPDIGVSNQTVTDFKMTAVLHIAPNATVGPRAITVKIPTRDPETFPGVFTVEAGLGKGGLASPVRDQLIPALIAVTPNSAIMGESGVTVNLTGTPGTFAAGAEAINFGILSDITVTSFKIHSPTSATATVDIARSARIGPRPLNVTLGPPTLTTTNGLPFFAAPIVCTLPNGFTIKPLSTSEPQPDRYEPNDRSEDAKLILSGMASCYGSYRGRPTNVLGGETMPAPPTATISANFHSASDTSDWFRVSTYDGPPIQISGQPIRYPQLQIRVSISDGPPDGIYQFVIREGTTVLRTSTSEHAPTLAHPWLPTQTGLITSGAKNLTIEVRRISGAPSNQFYKLHIKLGD